MVPSVSQGLTYLVNKRSLNVSFIVGVILSTKKKKKTEENKRKPSISWCLCN